MYIRLRAQDGKTVAKVTVNYQGITSVWQAVACHKMRVIELSFTIIGNTNNFHYSSKHEYVTGKKEVMELTLRPGYRILD